MIKYQSLCKLIENFIISLPSKIYQSIYAFKEILVTMSEVHFKELVKRIKRSPYFSIIDDESTDMASQNSLILYIRYYSDEENETMTEFLKLVDIEQFDEQHNT